MDKMAMIINKYQEQIGTDMAEKRKTRHMQTEDNRR